MKLKDNMKSTRINTNEKL